MLGLLDFVLVPPSSSRCLQAFKKAFAGQSKSNFCFPKFHLLLHYPDFIRRYGSLIPNQGYWWEAAMTTFLRLPYQVSEGRKGAWGMLGWLVIMSP